MTTFGWCQGQFFIFHFCIPYMNSHSYVVWDDDGRRISVVFQNFSSNLSRMKDDSQQKSSYQPNAICCARKENWIWTFLWLLIIMQTSFTLASPIFENEKRNRQEKLPSCLNSVSKSLKMSHLNCNMQNTNPKMTKIERNFTLNVVKWDFFSDFSNIVQCI